MPEHDLALFLLPKELKLLSTRPFRNGYLWEVEKTRQEFEVCTKCATPSNTRAGRCTALVRDQEVRGKPIWLRIHKHRYYCYNCRKRFTEPIDGIWPRRRTTQRFRKSLARQCAKEVSLVSVQRTQNVSSGLLYQVFYEQIEIKLRERKGAPWPSVLGIDEHFFRRNKGQTEFVTVFCDLKKNRLFEMALGKDQKSVISQVESIPGRENVRIVVMDLSNGYRSLVKKLFPNATIVGDKFHVLRLLSPAIMKAGKEIFGHRKQLNWRKLLLKSRHKLDCFTRLTLDRHLVPYPKLRELYFWKERLASFYRIKGFRKATRAFRKLIDEMANSKLDEIKRLRRTLIKWKNEILVYFERRYTNAVTEAINNLAKLVQKRAFGYKSFRNYRLRTLSACLTKEF